MTNTLYTGDNLHFLHRMNTASVDLIYLDPPFNSKRTYSAPIGSKAAGTSFKDMWSWNDIDEQLLETLLMTHPCLVGFIRNIEGIHGKPMMAYTLYMAQRIKELHRILKDTGSLYLHCDPTASHYLKVILDKIFGEKNFLNEIVWHYTGGGRSKTYFSRKHDVIFLYKRGRQHQFNVDKIRVPYGKKSGYAKSGITAASGKHYSPHPDGKLVEDVWEIPIINPISKERTGYPTQKPLALLHRIIEASSNEGDVVLDPFCGCATTCVAAQELNRRWIGIDIEKNAVNVLIDRLAGGDQADLIYSQNFIRTDVLPERTDIEIESPTEPVRQALYKHQTGRCNGCGDEFDMRHFELDHIIPKSKGGSDTRANYQLLCGSCNRIKGDRPMEYLRKKISLRDALLSQQITFGR